MLQPRVTDISHHNTVHDLHATAAAGIWGVIHKCTQGTSYVDPTYAERRPHALDAGMLWGAYHFNDATDPVAQVDFFLRNARPDNTTMLVLDYEDVTDKRGVKLPESRQMSPQSMVKFLRTIEQRVGRKSPIYSGNRLREQIGRLSAADRAYVLQHQLWLCAYSTNPRIIPGFNSVFLWQYTDGHFGPPPHGIPGITGDVDLNTFRGTREELEAVWVSPQPLVINSSDSSHSTRAAEDTGDVEPPVASRSDDNGSDGLPPFMGPSSSGAGGLNVQPVRARYDVRVEVVQRELDALGYHEIGDVDGLWGGKTAGAIRAFFNDRGLNDRAEMGDPLNTEIAQAKAERWTRPIAPSRANAQPKDVAPKIEAVRVSLWGRLSAKIGAGLAALGLGGSGLSDTFATVKYKMQPIQDMFNSVPGSVWFLLLLAATGGVWYFMDRAAKAATKDYNTGRLN